MSGVSSLESHGPLQKPFSGVRGAASVRVAELVFTRNPMLVARAAAEGATPTTTALPAPLATKLARTGEALQHEVARSIAESRGEALLGERHTVGFQLPEGETWLLAPPEPEESDTSVRLSRKEEETPAESGRVIQHTHELAPGHRMTEGAVRLSLASQSKGSLEERRAALQAHRERVGSSPRLEEEIHFCDQALRELSHLGSHDWVDSNHFRRTLKELRAQGQDFQTACEATMVTTPINMRFHALEGRESEGVLRVGVCTDFRFGMLSLTDLKKMKENPHLFQKKVQELATRFTLSKSSKEREVIAHLLQKIAPRAFQVLQNASHTRDEFEAAARDCTALDSVLHEREFILEQQTLHLLHEQIQRHPDQLRTRSDGSFDFTMVHLALLNPKTHKIDETGFVHDERVEMEDMEAAFELLKRKTITLDAKASVPFIDETGAIHLPPPPSGEAGEVHLQPLFFNVSVQGCTKNTPIQQEINGRALQQLRSAGSQFVSLRQVLESHQQRTESSYSVAEEIVHQCTQAKIPFSMGCMSAKDRTGFVSSRLMTRQMQATLASLPLPPKEQKARRAALDSQVLDRDGVSAQVVFDNTAQRVLKVSPLSLPGISAGRRIWYLFLQALALGGTKIRYRAFSTK